MYQSETEQALAELTGYIRRLERTLRWEFDITVQRVYRIRQGRLHVILNVGSNEYHIVYQNKRWRRA